MHDPNKTKWPVLTHVSPPLVKQKILKIQEDAVPENTKKATKSVFEITE